MPYVNQEQKREYDRIAKAKSRATAKTTASAESARPDAKARAWTCVVYPDSAPADWVDRLNGLHLTWAQSPMHDRDMNADGTIKKPHWHLLITYSGKKSYSQVLGVTRLINATIPQICHSIKGLVRYFTHKDNPEKTQYNASDIKCYGGIDLTEHLKPTASESMMLQREMVCWCNQYNCNEYADLLTYSLAERIDWFNELMTHSYAIIQFLRSRRHMLRSPINCMTGEIYADEN